MAIGIVAMEYPETKSSLSGKRLRTVSAAEVEKFNDDLANIAAQYGMDSIRSAIDEYQAQIFELVRQVMQEANSPYGGSGALGDEVVMRALRPIDVGIAADIWDTDYTAVVVGTAAQRQQAFIGATPASGDTMLEEEGNIFFGALSEHGNNRVINAYKWTKNQKQYPTLSLPFTYCDLDRAQFVKFQAPIMQFTEETLYFFWNVVRAEWNYVALVGIHACRASNVVNTYD